jgi:hypothetical protein
LLRRPSKSNSQGRKRLFSFKYSKSMLLEILALVWFIRIAIYDLHNHLIRNTDLIVTGALLAPSYFVNWRIACLGLGIYGLINLISGFKIGYGDIKLSFICSITLATLNDLSLALTATWISAGVFALTQPRRSIAFAPFMIFGTYLTKIPLP